MSLTPAEAEAIRSILDLLMPYSLDIKLSDVWDYVKGGFNRQRYIARLLQGGQSDDLMPAKLKLIYAELDRLYRINPSEILEPLSVP